jgi:hypothetical protein
MKFGNINFLEDSGQLQACNGTDLPLETEVEQTQPDLAYHHSHKSISTNNVKP